MIRSSLPVVLTGLALLGTSPPLGAAELTITVSGVTADGGEIGCALYAGADGFPMTPAKATQQWLPARADGVACRFADLAPGRYAVAVSHDRNGNRKTDTGLFGIPKEPWGVSNNVRPGMRPPRFEEAAIDVAADGTTVISVEVAQ